MANINGEGLFFANTKIPLVICLYFPKARIPAVITHKEQLRQAFVNITCKSVPSSLKKPSRKSTFGVVGVTEKIRKFPIA